MCLSEINVLMENGCLHFVTRERDSMCIVRSESAREYSRGLVPCDVHHERRCDLTVGLDDVRQQLFGGPRGAFQTAPSRVAFALHAAARDAQLLVRELPPICAYPRLQGLLVPAPRHLVRIAR